MTCKRASTWLQLYVDGRLSVRRLLQLEAHLDACQACREDLNVLEAICHGAAALDYGYEPADLTERIMRRVAAVERGRAAGRGAFGLGWGDALLAGLLATLMTALFLWFQPALSRQASEALISSLLTVDHGVVAVVSTWSAWVVWLIWGGAGLALAVWFAGGEVRAGWRRALADRLPH